MASLPFTTTPVLLTGPAKYNLQPAEGKSVGIADCRLPIADWKSVIFGSAQLSLFLIGNRQSTCARNNCSFPPASQKTAPSLRCDGAMRREKM
jgi:hypothetical protein